MFKTLFAFALIASSAPAFAQNAFGHIQLAQTSDSAAISESSALALPGSLHDTMKAMSKALKSIDASDASSNAQNATLADQFVALALHAKSFSPDNIDAAGKVKYAQMMDQTAATGRELAAAFRAGDNAKAAKLMDQLNVEKKQGHGEFK